MTMQAYVMELDFGVDLPNGVTVTEQCDGHWTVQGEASPAPTNASARCHPVAAHLWEAAPGLFAVSASPKQRAFLGWANKGLPMAAWCAAFGGDWPLKNNRTCVISSAISPTGDPRPVYKPPAEEE